MRAHWPLLAATGLGVLLASVLLAVVPVYDDAMADLGLCYRLEQGIDDPGDQVLQMTLDGSQLGDSRDRRIREAMDEATRARIVWLGDGLLVEERSQRIQASLPKQLGIAWPAYLAAMPGLAEHVEVLAGRLPEASDRAEVVLPAGYERYAAIGDTVVLALSAFDDCPRVPPSENPAVAAAEVRCRPSLTVAPEGAATVVGFVRRRDANDARWQFFDASWAVPNAPNARVSEPGAGGLLLITTPEQYMGVIAQRFPELRAHHRVGVVPDLRGLRVADVSYAIADIEAWQRDIQTTLGLRAGGRLDLAKHLSSFRDAQTFSRIPLLLILLQVVGVIVFYLVLAASMLADRRADEMNVYRSRGASAGQLAGLAAFEALFIAVPAALAGPWIAVRSVALLGYLPVFERSTGGGTLPAAVTPEAYAFSAAGALISVAAIAAPAWVMARRGVLDERRERARPRGRGFVQRYFLDVGVMMLAAAQFWQISRRGSVFDPKAVGGWSSDPLLMLFPLVLTLAVAAMVLRLYAPLLRFTLVAIVPLRGSTVGVGLQQMARAPATHARVLMLLVMATSVATFAASYGPTVSRSHRDRALYEVGTDLRATLDQPGSNVGERLAALRKTEGVRDATLVYRGALRAPTGGEIAVVGIEDPSRAGPMLWSRDDFAAQPLPALLDQIQTTEDAHLGIALPDNAVAIRMHLYADTVTGLIGFAARVRDAEGGYHELPVIELPGRQWREVNIEYPRELFAPRPLRLAGFRLREESFVRRDGALFIDDLRAVDATGGATLIDDFEAPSGWRVYTQPGTTEAFEVSSARTHGGVRAGRWSWETSFSQRESVLAAPDPDGALPALFSARALDVLRAREGGEALVVLENGVRVPLRVAGVVEMFPTIDPAAPFIVTDRVRLRALALLGGSRTLPYATEMWVDIEDSLTLPEQRALLTHLANREESPLLVDAVGMLLRSAMLDDTLADPSLVASGAGVLLVAAVAVVLIAAAGFGIAALIAVGGRVTEFAVLRALGVSAPQLLRSLLLEWGVLALCGGVLGFLLGRRIADVMLTALEVTSAGTRVVPPFTLQSDWRVIGAGLVVVGGCALAAVVVAWGEVVRRAGAAALRHTQ